MGKKKPVNIINPDTRKIPVYKEPTDEKIRFVFSNYDNLISFPKSKNKRGLDDFHSIAYAFKSFESMTWNQIFIDNSENNHAISLNDIEKFAYDRILSLSYDDQNCLWSLRLNGRQRLWGIREKNYFLVIWWDPFHQVCKSNLKNT